MGESARERLSRRSALALGFRTSVIMSSQQNCLSPVIPLTQTDLSAWKTNGLVPSSLKPSLSVKEEFGCAEHTDHDILFRTLGLIKVTKKREAALKKHLQTVEGIAWTSGLTPEGIDKLLEMALSGQYGEAVKSRMLKCLIPATVIPESSVVKALSRICATNCSSAVKAIFFRWLIAMFDFIDPKDELNSLYGFFFSFLQEEYLCSYICHLLYLLTKRENVKPFRVRKLLALQSKVGMQPYLQALLSLYKSFCPDLLTISLPLKRKSYFKTCDRIWQAAVSMVKQRNKVPSPSLKLILTTMADVHPQRKKWNSGCVIPKPCSRYSIPSERWQMRKGASASLQGLLSAQKSFPLEQLHTFSQLLENIQDIQLPSQMCSVLNSSPLLHYLNCIHDESVSLRLYYWMSQELKEGCPWYKVNNDTSEEEFKHFLNILNKAQCFLQEGFPSTEVFLYKSLPLWDGISCRTEYLHLLSWIPLGNFSEIKPLFCDSLAQVFFTSSIYHKCSVLYTLTQLLRNWLLWHAMEVKLRPMMSTSPDTTLSALASVSELIYYVGWLSTTALHLEKNSSFLLHFILDFFETVSDIYLNYNLPLVVIFPRGVFYPALLTSDSVAFNHLCYIMYRYRVNLTAAKDNELLRQERLKFNKTYEEFNEYVTALVDCLWTSTSFGKDHCFYIDPEILEKTKIQEYKKSLNLINHPALQVYAIHFLLQGWPEEKELSLCTIKKKKWNWYLDYLFMEDLHGLHLFMESSLNIADRASSVRSYPDDKIRDICTLGPI